MRKIYYNGDIITMRSPFDSPEAIAIENGKVLFLGSLDEAKVNADNNTEYIDLHGHTLLPSFIDSHSHCAHLAKFIAFADLSECKNFNDIVKTLNEYKLTNPDIAKNVIIGTGYDHNLLSEKYHPNKTVLDKVSTDVPVLIINTSSHMAVANSLLLRMSGYSNDMKDPKGGKYGRFRDGSLSGYLEEFPAYVPARDKAFSLVNGLDMSEQMRKAQMLYLTNGITTVQDGLTAPDEVKDLVKFAEDGIFSIDTVSYVEAGENGIDSIRKEYSNCSNHYYNRYRIGGEKLILDGSPQGKTAWLLKPYINSGDYRGYPTYDDAFVESALKSAITGGYQALIHCNGDAASNQFIRCYNKVLNEKKTEIRPVMVHAQMVHDDQLDEMKRLGIIPSFFVEHIYYWSDVHAENMGKERAERFDPAGSALSRKMIFTFHQDTPVRKPDMLHTIWCAVNRVSKKGILMGADQCIPVYEALKAVTINAAYQYHEERSKGTLESGKLANMVILDENPLKVKKEEIENIKVLETIREGETLYHID